MKTCDLEIYFHRPDELRHLLFCELFRFWIYSYSPPQNPPGGMVFEIEGLNIPRRRTIYLYRRTRNNLIVRLNNVSILAGEIWYLRLIIKSVAVISYVDCLTVNGIFHDTFQEAAHARLLVVDSNEALQCFRDSMALMASSRELRALFVTLTLHGFPTRLIYIDDICRERMFIDYTYGQDGNQPVNGANAENMMLLDIQSRLASENRQMSDFGLPEPVSVVTELQRERLNQNPQLHQNMLNELNLQYPNTLEMQECYDYIEHLLRTNQGGIYTFLLYSFCVCMGGWV